MNRAPTLIEARVLYDMGLITEAQFQQFQHLQRVVEWRQLLRAGANSGTTRQASTQSSEHSKNVH